MKRSHGRWGNSSRKGAALIITLAFMILLAALLVIFFTQSLSYRQLSNGNFNDFKSATIGQSALETVVGDLSQEMTNGASSVLYYSGTNVAYAVTNNANAVPRRSGTNYVSGVDQTPNLVRISVRSDGISYPAVGSRASAVSSTQPAVGGQYVSPARWNKHYLLPRNPSVAGSTSIDTTPTANFIPPDWVFVTDQGPTVLTAPSTKTIGRYAYAIYDEGGLLDANIAGVPSNTQVNASYPSTAPNTNMMVWGSGNKGSEAFADLTVPITVNGSSVPLLTQPQIDQLVGWRDNATLQPSGSFGGSSGNPLTASGYTISYDSTGAKGSLAYHDAMALNTNGLLVTSGKSWSDPTSGKTDTDQIFVNRQALISFFNSAHLPQDSLQYFGTFSRALEQPCYNPPIGRPMVAVLNTSATVNTSPVGIANDMWHMDRVTAAPTTNAPTDINPPALAVRVSSSFTRRDGTTAQIGEALLKKRFPLSRLGEISSSYFNFDPPPTSTATANLDPVYRDFGLYRGAANLPWKYNHDVLNTTGIDKLSTVATLGREPDFFEILRAAINVGSVGKGAAYSGNTYLYTSAGTAGYLDQAKDRQSQLQILQIGANIIDQAKADNFPTRIQFSGLSTYEVRGDEDLPYLYRIYDWIMETGSGSLGVVMLQPQLWNPHSTGSSSLIPATATPKSFRVRVALDSTSSVSPFSGLTANYYHASTTDVTSTCPFNTPNGLPLPAPLTFNAGAANSYWDFREPTLLAQLGKPANSNLSTTDPTYIDSPTYAPDPSRKMLGFLVGSFPWYNPVAANYNYKFNISQSGNNSCVRFFVEYLDSSGNWITYDEMPLQPFDGVSLLSQVPQTSGGANVTTFQDDQSILSNSNSMFGYGKTDPRTSRWGFHIGQFQNKYTPVTTGPSADSSADPVVWSTDRPDGGLSYGNHIGGRKDLGFVGTVNSYPYQNRGFQHAYWAENSTRSTYQSDGTSGSALLRYNVDPDGVPRRTEAGYVTDSANGGQAASASQSLTGLPEANGNYSSRPTILHRPFRSVAELGYVFRDTPWGSINFNFPESGDSALLDYFCINETSDANGMVAGRVNLNTRQAPVIAALLSGTLRDKDDSSNPTISPTMASDIANILVARTSGTTVARGPLMSRADLVGTWTDAVLPVTSAGDLKTAATAFTLSPDNFYSGFSYDLGTSGSVFNAPTMALIPRQREAVMRALVDSGDVRTWNLLIDLVAQSGRFPPAAAGLSNFVVEGEKHYWLHVAIDRYTGKVIDSQLEVVRE